MPVTDIRATDGGTAMTAPGAPRGLRRRELLIGAAVAALAGCTSAPRPRPAPAAAGTTQPSPVPTTKAATPSPAPPTPGTAAEILARSTVPVLCYHQLREPTADDSAYARTMITPSAVLATHLRAISDGGWTPVTATALVDHLQYGTPLPERALLLSFDDGHGTQFAVGFPTLQRFGFPAIFFPMTVVLDKPDWLSTDQLRRIAGTPGMTIGAHTWDHHRMDRLTGDEWRTQVVQPKATLEGLLGRPVDLLAYPFGVWNDAALQHVAAAGYRAAFQLSSAQDPAQPLLTIRRVMPNPAWDGPSLLAHLASDFARRA